MSALTDTLRAMVKVRGKSVPLSDLIRICQQAADRIDELEREQTPTLYKCCAQHAGMPFTPHKSHTSNFRQVCPHCEAFHAQE